MSAKDLQTAVFYSIRIRIHSPYHINTYNAELKGEPHDIVFPLFEIFDIVKMDLSTLQNLFCLRASCKGIEYGKILFPKKKHALCVLSEPVFEQKIELPSS